MSVEETMELVRRADQAEIRANELAVWVTALVLTYKNGKGVCAIAKATMNKVDKHEIGIKRLKTGSVKFTAQLREDN